MFNRKEFVQSFSLLGGRLGMLARQLADESADLSASSMESSFLTECGRSSAQNPFFTSFMQSVALKRISEDYLTEVALERLLSFSDSEGDLLRKEMAGKTVGIIMAGNIPAVGFHGLLSALSTGAGARVKLSSKDRFLIPAIVDVLKVISPGIASRISFEPLAPPYFAEGKIDFLLFSGSDQTKALLSDEFRGIPLLARGSRFSLGVLSGSETESDLERLAEDMFLYCGMGCRSISYLFLPDGYDPERIIGKAAKMRHRLEEITPYINSYRRLKAISILEGRLGSSELDGGFFLLEKSGKPYPPLGVVRYSFYSSEREVESFCKEYRDKIQKKYTNFGFAQAPATDDWMDGINTPRAILEGCLGSSGIVRQDISMTTRNSF